MSSDKQVITGLSEGCEACASPTEAEARTTLRPDKERLIKRLNRIEGQVRGIGRMIEEDRYCIDVLTQISAAHSALDGIAKELLAAHTRGCVARAIQEGEGEAAMTELMQVISKWMR